MINGYHEYLEAINEAKDNLSESLARQSLDNSRRGFSVNLAIVRMNRKILEGAYGEIPGPSVRALWNASYAEQRKFDTQVRTISDRAMVGFIKLITQPRKIDQLIGLQK